MVVTDWKHASVLVYHKAMAVDCVYELQEDHKEQILVDSFKILGLETTKPVASLTVEAMNQ